MSATDTGNAVSPDILDRLPSLVSVDDHVVEPPTLWQERLPSKYRDVAPRVERKQAPSLLKPGEMVWADAWRYEDKSLTMTIDYGSAGRPPDEILKEPITFDDMRPGCFDPIQRLSDMDLDGVEASVCFPNTFVRFCGQLFLEAKDRELAMLGLKAYNDWLFEEWCGKSGGRLVGSFIVPLWDAELAAAEVRRNAARGGVSVCFSEIPVRLGLPSMYSGYWEPFFEACAETDTVINVHIGSSSTYQSTSDDAPNGVVMVSFYGNSSLSLTDWLLCGAFLRHPRLKIALSEGQAGWMPYLAERLDALWLDRHEHHQVSKILPEPPSSYLKDHVYACIFDDQIVLRHLDVISEDNLCFETDYPHSSGSWPESRAKAYAQVSTLTPEQQVKVLRMNAARLYRIGRVLDAG